MSSSSSKSSAINQHLGKQPLHVVRRASASEKDDRSPPLPRRSPPRPAGKLLLEFGIRARIGIFTVSGLPEPIACEPCLGKARRNIDRVAARAT